MATPFTPPRPLAPLFSVRFGIALLGILFVYMAVGSAGVLYPVHPNIFHPDAWEHAQMRQWRPFEMTEFEWFHWWPFDLLMGLLALNIACVTLARIPFRPVNYGVWLIHSGILLLILGSVIYFGTKVEGEAAVVRRAVQVEVRGEDGSVVARASLIASPGSRTTLGSGKDLYEVEVQETDPNWTLRTGDDEGKSVFSVTLSVVRPGERFLRQLIDGHPELAEDVLFTQDPKQPVQRAKKVAGKAIVHERLVATLAYEAQPDFYFKNDLNKSWALYVRRPGQERWHQRPIHGLPLYNDYLPSLDEVFLASGATAEVDPVRVEIPPTGPEDPAPGVTLEATGYLRYAEMRARWTAGGPDAPANPVAFVEVADGEGRRSAYRLVAKDPQRRSADGGVIALREIVEESQLAEYLEPPTLVFRVPSLGIEQREPVKEAALAKPDAGMRPIGPPGSGYSYRVVSVQDDLPMGARSLSVAILEMRTPAGEFRRWAFSDPTMSRDIRPGEDMTQAKARGGESWVDDRVQVEYRPGNGLALVLLVSGPEPGRLRVIDALGGKATVREAPARAPIELAAGLRMAIAEWMPNAVQVARPTPVPPDQRMRDARELFSMMRLSLAGAGSAPAASTMAEGAPALGSASVWLAYHPWAFDRQEQVLRRYWLRPTTVRLPDGSELEVLFSRQRRALPSPIALDSFELATNIGGFSGETSSIRNYTSIVRFQDGPAGAWTPPMPLSVNEPVEHAGLWYFQSQWDPPEEAREGGMRSAGLNYTVLGVANRHGVYLQLGGCVVACLGMIYAFYVKPVIKRRNRQRVLAEIEAARAQGRAPNFPRDLAESVHA